MIDPQLKEFIQGKDCRVDWTAWIGFEEHGKGRIILADGVRIKPFAMLRTCSGTIYIGKNSSIGAHAIMHALGDIRIGEDVLISPKASIFAQNHGIKAGVKIALQPQSADPVNIGNDVWIGAGATIVGPVSIGNGAVVGAGCVITRDVPAGAVMAGNPAQLVKSRDTNAAETMDIFSESQEDRDLELAAFTGLPVEQIAEFKLGGADSIRMYLDEDVEMDSYDFIYKELPYLKKAGYLRSLSAYAVIRRKHIILALEQALQGFGGKRMLDHGCGAGSHGIYCLQKGAELDFLDVDGPLFEYAKYRIERRGLQAGFLFPENELADHSYDAIICLEVLEHVANPVEIFKQLSASLKIGGVIALLVSSMIKPTSGHFSKPIKEWQDSGETFLDAHYEKLADNIYRRKA